MKLADHPTVRGFYEKAATAQVLRPCQEIQPGDIAFPAGQKPLPQLRAAGTFDRFAPPSGKTQGLIVTGKGFMRLLGAGDVVYLDKGASNGVAVGQFFRIFRTRASASRDYNDPYLDETLTYLSGMRQSYRFTLQEKMNLPRTILGELVILSVDDRSAVGLITLSAREIYAGDDIELE